MSQYEPDELYVLRSRFYAGNFTQALNEAQSVVADSDTLTKIRDAIVVRSYLALGNYKQAASVRPHDKAIALYVAYKSNGASMRSAAEVEAELENVRLEDPVDRVFAALLYLELGNVKQALRSVHGGESLEEIAISVLGLLKVDRVDLAEKTLAKMTEVDDDDTIVQLAKAWVNLHKGFGKQSEKVQDVLDSIHEMIEKNGKTAFLLELLAATEIRNGNYSEAIKILKEARSTAISTGVKPGTATLFNTLVTLNHLDPNTARSSDQPGLFDHVKDELKKTYPNHPYFEKISALESLFDRSGSRYSS